MSRLKITMILLSESDVGNILLWFLGLRLYVAL
jgi:hypothetical protein